MKYERILFSQRFIVKVSRKQTWNIAGFYTFYCTKVIAEPATNIREPTLFDTLNKSTFFFNIFYFFIAICVAFLWSLELNNYCITFGFNATFQWSHCLKKQCIVTFENPEFIVASSLHVKRLYSFNLKLSGRLTLYVFVI